MKSVPSPIIASNTSRACLPDDLLGARGKSGPLLVNAPSASAGEVEIVLFDDAEDDQFRTVTLGALDRFICGVTRGRCQVDGQQDPRPARR